MAISAHNVNRRRTDTLAALNRKAQQTEELTVAEQQQQAALLALYQSSLVRRATAINLLKQRGEDISSLLTLPPL